jgi:hypothetical protein
MSLFSQCFTIVSHWWNQYHNNYYQQKEFDMTLAKWQIEDMESLEGRDLMWFFLDCWDNNLFEGDHVTQFLCDHISESSIKEYIKEANNVL